MNEFIVKKETKVVMMAIMMTILHKMSNFLSVICMRQTFLMSLLLVFFKFQIWDYQYLFDGLLPRHDGLHGIAGFAASMHSLRMSGDIAWWNPVGSEGGYAMYYPGFLSPLAPTFGSIVFILWGVLVRIVSVLGVILPEYSSYIVVNFLIYPFLTCYFLMKLGGLFFEKSISQFLLGIGYVFSCIGLWNDSWYYWQDSFYMFLVLYGIICFLKNPDESKNYFVLCASMLCFVSSLNYWSLHNLLFIGVFISLYLVVKGKSSFIASFSALLTQVVKHKMITSVVAFSCVVWVILIGSVYFEQSENYMRTVDGTYSVAQSFNRGKIKYPYIFTVENFNPTLPFSADEVKNAPNIINIIHDARYIGVCSLILLLLTFFRREKDEKKNIFFIILTMINLLICLLPGYMLPAWRWFLDFDQHFFYFYATFFQVSLLFLAASNLDLLLRSSIKNQEWFFKGTLVACILLVGIALCFGYNLLKENTMIILIIAGASAFLLSNYCGNRNYIWIVLFVLLFAADITRYYYEAARADYEFTLKYFPREGTGSQLLYLPFLAEDNNTFTQNIYENSPPVDNYLYPNNIYMPFARKSVLDRLIQDDPENIWNYIDQNSMKRTLSFYKTANEYRENLCFAVDQYSENAGGGGSYNFTKYSYNDFEIEYTINEDMWGVFLLSYDTNWKFTLLDKQANTTSREMSSNPANITLTAVYLPAGTHKISIEYRPFARLLYPFAVTSLLGSILFAALLHISDSRTRNRTIKLKLKWVAPP
jgi:hypothetical protein